LDTGPARHAGQAAASAPPGGAGQPAPGGEAGAGAEPARGLSPSAAPAIAEAAAVIEFWFAERCQPLWFAREDAFDAEIRAAFAELTEAAAAGICASWAGTPEGTLALLILLDQFPRNLNRGSPRAFAADRLAREVAAAAIAAGVDRALPWDRRRFFYLPFEHSEDEADQTRSVALFRAWLEESPAERRADAEDQLDAALRHQEIVQRFGRFPHRNAALGRVTTPAEVEFLQEPRSSF
jgi:uncharacterized protein (DUF924 family)